MTPEQWQQVRDVLHSAVQLPANQRMAYLDAQCSGDPSLRREVEQLLAAEGDVPTSFLESPALEQLPPQTESKFSDRHGPIRIKSSPFLNSIYAALQWCKWLAFFTHISGGAYKSR